VLYDQGAAADVPQDPGVPGLAIGDRDAEVSFAALTDVLAPVTAMAVQLRAERDRLRRFENLLDGIRSGEVLVGRCPVMRRLQGTIRRASCSEATVLIEGPSGSGKSLASRMIHCGSRHAGQPIVAVEGSELDASAMNQLIAEADGTTLVLENIEQLPSAAQAVLVKHLKERSGPRAASKPRIIATTSAHLPELVAKGVVREDLYYRLNAFPMVLPALREHLDDVRLIAETTLQLASAQTGRAEPGFTPAAIVLLESMQWPGNVTQLEAVVKRAYTLAAGSVIDREHIAAAEPEPRVTGAAPQVARVGDTEREDEVTEEDIRPFEQEEQDLLSRALRATKGNVRRAAQLLGIGRATLYRKIQQYKLRLQ
jgi:two-component system response regulator FlrC